MREAISIVSRVAMLLQNAWDWKYVVYIKRVVLGGRNIILKTVRIFCGLVRVHLQYTFVQFSSPTQFRVLAQKFEVLH